MGGMRKLKNSRKKSLGHELDLDRWYSNREKSTSKLEGNFMGKQNWRNVYKPYKLESNWKNTRSYGHGQLWRPLDTKITLRDF